MVSTRAPAASGERQVRRDRRVGAVTQSQRGATNLDRAKLLLFLMEVEQKWYRVIKSLLSGASQPRRLKAIWTSDSVSYKPQVIYNKQPASLALVTQWVNIHYLIISSFVATSLFLMIYGTM
jgi:hypothetical protein